MTAISDDTQPPADEPYLNFKQNIFILSVVGVICWIGNVIGPGMPPLGAAIGILLLVAISLVGLLIARFVPLRLPAVAWISLLAILVCLPGMPTADFVLRWTNDVNFIALGTPCVAYAGLAIAEHEVAIAKRSGWKILIVALLVMIGTFLGSAIIAQMFL
ncbi:MULTISPECIES: hypothetical protein [Sulfitobacter]|uniref:DUF340 domain-containing protein n=1 Tax=Sulfitobacter dubius TaxID=218673 RepID=A0ABY3ZPC5_9RHOB|nr:MULTISPECIES: hypothetical protein [Sulfitobacter]UOA16505.1 hypothetical protein DSM109990_03387 [Sulfitobacter dubius]UOA33774.1 hypothetical protein DSM110093_03609 [Sulfitobacter sp. DSM 110093]UOA34035.1 hypothetical protein DSM110093_03870 [Sulfitobacter sp. DSM 110093]